LTFGFGSSSLFNDPLQRSPSSNSACIHTLSTVERCKQ
jgi:hypothetical protein